MALYITSKYCKLKIETGLWIFLKFRAENFDHILTVVLEKRLQKFIIHFKTRAVLQG